MSDRYTCTVDSASVHKKQAEDKIRTILNDFMEQTGLFVCDVSYMTSVTDGKHEIRQLQLRTELL